MKIDTRSDSNLHVIVQLLASIVCHDVDSLKLLEDFSVRMLQRSAQHVVSHADLHVALGIQYVDGTIERDENAAEDNCH